MLYPREIWAHICAKGYLAAHRTVHRMQFTLKGALPRYPDRYRTLDIRERPTGEPHGEIAWYVEIGTVDVRGVQQTRANPKRFNTLAELDRLLSPAPRLAVTR